MALTDNLLAYWNLDTDSWLDSSGNNNTLINVNGVSLENGIINGGAYKNSINQFLVNSSFAGFGTGDFSVSVWVNYSASSDYANIVSTRDYDYRGGDCWCIGIHQGELFFWNYEFLLGFHPLATNIWNHIVVTRASGLLKLYINGSLITTGNDSVYDYTRSGIAIGGNTVSTPYTIDGTIDEVGVWGRALSQEEVTSILNTTGAGNLNAGVLAYWKMDEESGTRIDATGNGFNLREYPLNPGLRLPYRLAFAWTDDYGYHDYPTFYWSDGDDNYHTEYYSYIISRHFDSHQWTLWNRDFDVNIFYNDSANFEEGTWHPYDTATLDTYYPQDSLYSNISYDGNGVINDAALFDRTSYLSYYNDAEDLPIPINHNNFSVAGWVKLNDNNNHQTFFSQWDNSNGGDSWSISYINDDVESISLTVHTYSVNKIDITPNIPLNVGEWYHITFTYDGVNLLLYLNGQLVGSAINSSGIYNSYAPIEIGSLQGGYYKLNGSIDELGIWNRVLSEKDIFNLYYRRDGNSYPFEKPVITQTLNDELLAYYPLDENTGTRYDFANGYDLTQEGIVGSEKGIIKGTTKNINNGLLAYWNLDNDTWLDSTSSGYTLTSEDGVSFNTPGFIGTGNAIFAKDAYGGLSGGLYNSSFPTNWGYDNFTFGSWVYLNSYGKNPVTNFGETIVDFRQSGSGGIFLNITTDGYIRLWGNTQVTTSVQVLTGEWFYLNLVRSSGVYKLYINGILNQTIIDSGDNYNSNAIIFGRNYDGLVKLDGSLDEIGIWDRALSNDEIHALYNNGIGTTYPLPIIKNNLAASFVGTANNSLYNNNIYTGALWSMSFWVNVRSDYSNNPEQPFILTCGSIGGIRTIPVFTPDGNTLDYRLYVDSVGYIGSPYNSLYGNWNHYAITCDTINGVTFYINNILIGSTNDQGIIRSWTKLTLGKNEGGGYELDGLIDDVKVWNRSITSDEVLSIYKSGLPKTSKYNFQKVLGIPTYTFEKVTPQSILDLPFYIKSGSGGAGKLTIPLYQDGLYGKRYVGYYPDNGGVTAFGTLPRSTDNYPPHGDEEATVDFYNFSSSPNGSMYDFYSWQWTGYFKAPYTDDFVFRVAHIDDAVDLWIGDNAISGFTSQNRITGGFYNADNTSDPIHMIGGHYYPVRLQFGEASGADQFILEYSSSTESNISNFQGRFFHLTDQDLPAS
jgi:Concanavalin A-like lectin/glucanases superfamily/GLEYA domain